jgi:hypothetical protein
MVIRRAASITAKGTATMVVKGYSDGVYSLESTAIR